MGERWEAGIRKFNTRCRALGWGGGIGVPVWSPLGGFGKYAGSGLCPRSEESRGHQPSPERDPEAVRDLQESPRGFSASQRGESIAECGEG